MERSSGLFPHTLISIMPYPNIQYIASTPASNSSYPYIHQTATYIIPWAPNLQNNLVVSLKSVLFYPISSIAMEN